MWALIGLLQREQSGLGSFLLVRTVVCYLPLLHMSGYANKCEPWSDCFKGSSPDWAHISCKNSCLLFTPAPHVRVMQTNVSPDRTASKGAVRSGLIFACKNSCLLSTPAPHVRVCKQTWSDCFKESSPVWAHIACKNSCLLCTPAPQVRVCKQMWTLIGLLQREQSGLGSYCL